MPRRTAVMDLKSLARAHTATCVKVLAGIVRQKSAPPGARVSAAGILLERGWGKAPQDVTIDGDIKITIRKMLEDDEPGELIDVTPGKPLLTP